MREEEMSCAECVFDMKRISVCIGFPLKEDVEWGK